MCRKSNYPAGQLIRQSRTHQLYVMSMQLGDTGYKDPNFLDFAIRKLDFIVPVGTPGDREKPFHILLGQT